MPEVNKETKTVTMHIYKNTSKVALTIPELGIVIPVGGFSSPIPEPTETIKELVAHTMLQDTPVEVGESGLPKGNAAVMAGETSTEMQGKPAPAFAAPIYLPVANTPPQSRIKNYEGKGGVKDAVQHTVVAIRDGSNPNPYSEIPPESMATILQQSGKNFSTEMSSGEFIEDQAQQIISKSQGAGLNRTAVAQPLPANTPNELRPWLMQTQLQKKIAVFKTTDAEFLATVRNFERDANVISCIDTKLSEMNAGK